MLQALAFGDKGVWASAAATELGFAVSLHPACGQATTPEPCLYIPPGSSAPEPGGSRELQGPAPSSKPSTWIMPSCPHAGVGTGRRHRAVLAALGYGPGVGPALGVAAGLQGGRGRLKSRGWGHSICPGEGWGAANSITGLQLKNCKLPHQVELSAGHESQKLPPIPSPGTQGKAGTPW